MIKKATTALSVSVLLASTFFIGTYVGHTQAEDRLIADLSNQTLGQPNNVDFAPFWKAWNILDEKYVATATTTASSTNQDRVYGAIKGMTEALGDPYTTFFPPEEAKSFNEEIQGNFQGVGMEVGMKDEELTIISAIKNTPASRAGLKAGDKILKIDETVTANLSVDEAVKLIRGEKGTAVNFTLVREGGEPFTIKVIRDTINIPTIETEKRADGVFIIRLLTFTSNSPELFRGALREFVLSKSSKLILDLRGNPGGYLEASVDIASWFLPSSDVVVRENFGPGKDEVVYRSKGYDIFNDKLKFAILIDGGSASASEILAGALKEQGKAILVGKPSFGKGSVQELVKLTEDTNLKITIARWLTPKGFSISKQGLTPDVQVEFTEEDYKAGRDPQLNKAIELLK